MLAISVLLFILVIYFFKIRKQLAKDKIEKRWFFILSAIAVGMALLVFLNVPVDAVLTLMNETLGDFTKQVIKL